jgi:hypothetical protein
LLNVVSQILWCHHLHIGLLPRQVCQQTNKQTDAYIIYAR